LTFILVWCGNCVVDYDIVLLIMTLCVSM